MKLWLLAASFAASPTTWKGSTLQLLQALDLHGVRYPPTATRGELEALWADCEKGENPNCSARESTNSRIPPKRSMNEPTNESFDNNANDDDISRRQHRRRRRQRRHQRQLLLFPDVIAAPTALVPSAVRSTASNLWEHGYRTVRSVKRDLVDAWMETEDGVRTVPYQYVERFNEEVLDNFSTTPRQPSRHRPRRKNPSRAAKDRSTYQSAYSPSRSARSTSRRRSRSRRNNAITHPRLLLPPAGTTHSASIHTSSTPPPDRQSDNHRDWQRPPKRRIYSPYETSPTDPSHPRRGDILDDIGSFFVEAADRAVWGADDASTSTAKQSSKKDWRDQWEERLDSMLGIHSNGEPYRRWTDGTQDRDTIIPSQQQRRRRNSPYPQTPLWGGGSIVSLIFSSREPRYTSLDNVDALWESSGSVLTILRWSVRRLARYYGNLCRWATVHRAIPQPAVVTLVTSILLSTAKRRWLAAGIALVATRAIGEAVRENSGGGWDSINDNQDDGTSSQVTEDGEGTTGNN